MSKNIQESIGYLDKAITSLQQVVAEPVDKKRFIVDSTIQRFEYTFELFWKTLGKKLFQDYKIEAFGPKKILEQAYMAKLIDDEKLWLAMLEDRNLTTHVYKEVMADAIYEHIKKYAPFLRLEFEKCFKNKK